MDAIDKKYTIVKELGGGAFSNVYLVKSENVISALKLLKSDTTLSPTENNLTCFKNEFAILKNLNHPNIARILDFGLDAELMQYYFTTEYVEGTDIYSKTAGQSVLEITELFVQALRALEYLHSYRVFHFDIKAANILVTKKNMLKLIDFGLASIDPKGKLMGTPSYMAPEIIRGEKPDGRADIYSLGVLWYYCLCRKNPFRSSDGKVTLENQKSLVPPNPSSIKKNIPQYLDQIICRMIEKRPEKRYPRPSLIIKELNLLGGHSYEMETYETLLSYIPERGRFLGRKKEINLIKKDLVELKEQKKGYRSLLITGAHGTGKKRLIDEIKYYAQINEINVEVADAHDIDETIEWLDKIDLHIKTSEGVKSFLLHSAEWLEAHAKIFERLKNSLSRAQAYRDSSRALIAIGIDRTSSVLNELERIMDDKITLENFNHDELRDYIINLTGLEDVPDYLTQEVFKRTEGNPLFVTEIAKSLITSGALFDSKGRWQETSFIDLGVDFKKIFPKSLKELLIDRFYDLSDSEKEIAMLLAVAGRPSSSFEISSWKGSQNISAEIENLIRKDILTRHPPYNYYFKNELLAGFIMEDMEENKKELYHDQIAAQLSKQGGEEEEIVCHIGHGSDQKLAFQKTFASGARYLKEGLGRKGIEFLNIARERAGAVSEKEEIELYMKLGEGHLISQDYKNALNFFNIAGDKLAKLDRTRENMLWHIDNFIKIGGTYIKLNELEKAEQIFKTSGTLLKKNPDAAREIVIKNWEAYLAMQHGKLDESEMIYKETRKLVEKLPPEKRSNVTNNELGTVLLQKGRIKDAMDILSDDLKYYENSRDELLVARRLYGLAQAHQLLENYKEASAHFQKAEEIARNIKDVELLFRIYNGLGNIYNITSQLEKSRDYYERARNLSFQSGDFRSHSAISINIGTIENKLGNTDIAYYELTPAIIYLRNSTEKSLFDWQILNRAELELIDILAKKGEFREAEKMLASAKDSAKHISKDDRQQFWLLAQEAGLRKEAGQQKNLESVLEELSVLANTAEEKEIVKSLSMPEEDMGNIYSVISEISKLVNSESPLPEIFKLILDHVNKMTGAEIAAVVLKGNEGVCINVKRVALEKKWDDKIAIKASEEATNTGVIVEIENSASDERFSRYKNVKSILCAPILVKGNVSGALYLESSKKSAFKNVSKDLIKIFTDQIGIALDKTKTMEELSLSNIKMKSQLDELSVKLEQYEKIMDGSIHGFATKNIYENIIGRSKKMQEVLQTVDKVTDTDISILITGESGTGKELIARALHFNSMRNKAGFVTINCGAIPANLMESEFFGYKAGAFTGASHDKKGLFEEAIGGTIFLDEVTEIEPSLQAKLLRVIQEREFNRIGDTKPRACDVRIISATNKDIDREMKEGRFREDLYWRICQLRLHVPPLRERREDIPLLVKYFLKAEPGGVNKTIDPALLKNFIEYDWPGNIRELESLISVVSALSGGNIIGVDCVPENYGISKFVKGASAASFEKSPDIIMIDEKNTYCPDFAWHDYTNLIFAKAYEANNFKAHAAAKELGVSPTTIYSKIKELNLDDRKNALYLDKFEYSRGKSLRSYTLPIFKAALKHTGGKSTITIKNLGISQGFFYKIIKKPSPF